METPIMQTVEQEKLKSLVNEYKNSIALLAEVQNSYLLNVDDEGMPKTKIKDILQMWNDVSRTIDAFNYNQQDFINSIL